MAMLESVKRKATLSILDKLRADGMPGRTDAEAVEGEEDDPNPNKKKKKVPAGVQDPEGLPSETTGKW
jgi:hypothetical protein